MTGAWNTASSSPMTFGGSDDDEERTKRKGWRAMMSLFRAARVRIA